MGTTDAKTGFRLPWSADRDDSGGPSDASVTTEDGGATVTPEHESETTQMIDANAAATDPATDAQERPVADGDPVAEQTDGATDPVGAGAGEVHGDEARAAEAPAGAADAVPADAPADPYTTARKPNRFMADLAKAMQAAAESARADTLARFAADAKTHIEGIHAATANEATDLRKQADDDVAAIREWSKTEIARIREEADDRIAHRKTALEHEVEAHAAEIEARIDLVQQRVSAFEAEMSTFFDRLMAEEDPTRFAAMAESLPEPPPFDVDQPWEPVGLIGTDDAPPVEDAAIETAVAAPDAIEAAPADDQPVAGTTTTPEEPVTETVPETSPEGGDGPSLAWTPGADDYGPSGWGDQVDPRIGSAAEAPEAPDAEATSEAETGSDPRLETLGGFAEAEAEAEAEANTPEADTSEGGPADDDVPVIADDALASRLSGLVPDPTAKSADEGTTTRLIVTGLVSVASIAGFKRHLSRLAGVTSVGVSSGPDGEFVFAVGHAEGLALDDAIATLPGFSARVTDSREGELTVAARDPEAEG